MSGNVGTTIIVIIGGQLLFIPLVCFGNGSLTSRTTLLRLNHYGFAFLVFLVTADTTIADSASGAFVSTHIIPHMVSTLPFLASKQRRVPPSPFYHHSPFGFYQSKKTLFRGYCVVTEMGIHYLAERMKEYTVVRSESLLGSRTFAVLELATWVDRRWPSLLSSAPRLL